VRTADERDLKRLRPAAQCDILSSSPDASYFKSRGLIYI